MVEHSAPKPTIWTIGHSNQKQSQFFSLLKQYGVSLLIDVRSSPYSRYVPHFNHDALAEAASEAGIEYRYMGKELGGKRKPPLSFARIARTPEFRTAVHELAGLAEKRRVAIVCGEENPAQCHRHMLIAPALMRLDAEVLHIRGDGRMQSYEEVERERHGGQVSLDFDSPDNT